MSPKKKNEDVTALGVTPNPSMGMGDADLDDYLDDADWEEYDESQVDTIHLLATGLADAKMESSDLDEVDFLLGLKPRKLTEEVDNAEPKDNGGDMDSKGKGHKNAKAPGANSDAVALKDTEVKGKDKEEVDEDMEESLTKFLNTFQGE